MIEVDDVDLKRRLYSALAQDGRSLKDWFVSTAGEYLLERVHGKQLEFPLRLAAEAPKAYGEIQKNEDV